jgi:hypothetical protein
MKKIAIILAFINSTAIAEDLTDPTTKINLSTKVTLTLGEIDALINAKIADDRAASAIANLKSQLTQKLPISPEAAK